MMNIIASFEKSALVSTSTRGGHGGNTSRGRGFSTPDERDRLKCDHCGRLRHTKDQCWDLRGRPQDLPLHSSL